MVSVSDGGGGDGGGGGGGGRDGGGGGWGAMRSDSLVAFVAVARN